MQSTSHTLKSIDKSLWFRSLSGSGNRRAWKAVGMPQYTAGGLCSAWQVTSCAGLRYGYMVRSCHLINGHPHSPTMLWVFVSGLVVHFEDKSIPVGSVKLHIGPICNLRIMALSSIKRGLQDLVLKPKILGWNLICTLKL